MTAAVQEVQNLPDMKVSIRQVFGIDSDMEVPAYSKSDEHVPEIDSDYRFDRPTTLAILAGFSRNRRVIVTGYHGTGKQKIRPDLGALGPGDDPFGLFGAGMKTEQKQQTERRQIRNAERKALDRLGLDVGATPAQVKIRFKELVKQFHPDVNGGDRSTEDRLVEVIQSYNYLKSAGFG